MASSGTLRRVALVILFLRIVVQLLVTTNIRSSQIPVTLMVEAIHYL
jgi:hypothetical protein